MTQEKRKFEDWLDYARKAKRVALLAHISPDGDTLGSTLALRLAFLALGKQVDVICDGDVPDNLKFLTGSESILHPEDVNGSDYDTAIAVDVRRYVRPPRGSVRQSAPSRADRPHGSRRRRWQR